MSSMVKSVIGLIASIVIVHLAYLGYIQPEAKLAIEAARNAGQSAPRDLVVILKDYEQEINILLKKFSLVVFKYSPDNSDLSENATAWTTKSISPHFDLISSNNFTTSSFFSTSQLNVTFEFNFSAKGITLFLKHHQDK